MQTFRQISTLTLFLLLSTESIYANYSYPTSSSYRAFDANQESDNYFPDMHDEDAFLIQSNQRFHQMQQANRNMMVNDREIMQKGYDPNESNASNMPSNFREGNYTYPSQEQMMQGKTSERYQPYQ